jgi:hypothetical protein
MPAFQRATVGRARISSTTATLAMRLVNSQHAAVCPRTKAIS